MTATLAAVALMVASTGVLAIGITHAVTVDDRITAGLDAKGLPPTFTAADLPTEGHLLPTADAPARPRGYKGTHRAGNAPGSTSQQHRWASPTDAFNVLVDASWTPAELVEIGERLRCGSCDPGRDGERPHVSCTGCSCPCRTVQAVGRVAA